MITSSDAGGRAYSSHTSASWSGPCIYTAACRRSYVVRICFILEITAVRARLNHQNTKIELSFGGCTSEPGPHYTDHICKEYKCNLEYLKHTMVI